MSDINEAIRAAADLIFSRLEDYSDDKMLTEESITAIMRSHVVPHIEQRDARIRELEGQLKKAPWYFHDICQPSTENSHATS